MRDEIVKKKKCFDEVDMFFFWHIRKQILIQVLLEIHSLFSFEYTKGKAFVVLFSFCNMNIYRYSKEKFI